MPAYRLLTTRYNRDGSVDTPSIDIVLKADNEPDAIREARSFPLDSFAEPVDFVWVLGEGGSLIWSFDPTRHAA